MATNNNKLDFDLIVASDRFSHLVQRAKLMSVSSNDQAIIDLNAPMADGDDDCDFSKLNSRVQYAIVQKLKDAKKQAG